MELNIWLFVGIGFFAQMIDGMFSMGYGVISSSFLLGFGLPPAGASSSVHMAEVFTTGFAGLSHLKFKNINKQLFFSLLIPGILGGVTGAYLLSNIDGSFLKPFVAIYLLAIGILIIWKSFNKSIAEARHQPARKKIFPLGLFGGFFDAIGGGGWGPIVTSTLFARDHNPHLTIGSVAAAEFFVTLAQSITFMLTIGLSHWNVIVGLLLGGVIAAPFAAFLTKKTPTKKLMSLVGVLIILLSIRTIYLAWF